MKRFQCVRTCHQDVHDKLLLGMDRECLLPFGPESFLFQFAVQKHKD